MRIRSIKPEFYGHPVMGRQPDSIRFGAIGLLSVADDEGYFLADPALIRSQVWPFDESSTNVRRVLAQLSAVGWIEVKTHPTHGEIGWVVNFSKHQRIDRPSPSKLKPYFLDEHSSNVRRALDESSLLDQGSGIREQGTGSKSVPPSPPAQPDLRLQSPAGDTGAEVRKVEKPKKTRERNPAFDALVEVGGGDPTQVTASEGGRVAKALSEIRATLPGLSVEDLAAEIRRRAANYRISHPDWELTCSALSTHWSSCNAAARQPEGKARLIGTGSKSAMQENIDQLQKANEEDLRQLEAARQARIAAGGPQPVPIREKIQWP